MTDYLVVTSPENWRTTEELGWRILGLKSTRRNVASGLHAGDRVICYATGVKRFLGVVEVDADCYEEHTRIWTGKNASEVYPYRYPIHPLAVVALEQAPDAVALAADLAFPKKWGAHLSLAFQGNIKPVPAGDVERVLAAVDAAATAPAPVIAG